MCSIRYHIFQPLTKLTPENIKFKWTSIEQDTLEDFINMVDFDVQLLYTYFNKLFDIYNYEIEHQIGTFIIHEGKRIIFLYKNLQVLRLGTL